MENLGHGWRAELSVWARVSHNRRQMLRHLQMQDTDIIFETKLSISWR